VIRRVKRLGLVAARTAGIFAATEHLTRNALRILCYHGLSVTDEHRFRPGLFVTRALFEKRLDWLHTNGFTVLPLETALRDLGDGRLPPKPVVITFDDGFYGTFRDAVPALEARRMPATVYVTSYYVAKGGLVFRLAVQYLFWKTSVTRLALADLGIDGVPSIGRESREVERVMWRLIDWGERRLSEPSRRELLHRLAALLEVDDAAMVESRGLGLMTPGEVQKAAARGVDIQLHTHRHAFPLDIDQAVREIEENRMVLEPIVGRRLRHFCYPSGISGPEFFPALERAGIASATTCESGFNTEETPRFLLRRFLDAEDIAPEEFEAEMRGALGLGRRLIRRERPGASRSVAAGQG
jgi:peptidoglycan/xylan/chitin deacetylase (PgdA/CDA1 family)